MCVSLSPSASYVKVFGYNLWRFPLIYVVIFLLIHLFYILQNYTYMVHTIFFVFIVILLFKNTPVQVKVPHLRYY